MREGRTIGFAELVKYILLKWRIILCCMVAFSVLAGGIGFLKSYTDYQKAEKQKESADYSQYEAALTENEVQKVKDAADDYLAYEKVYLDYKGYISESIKMQIDANAVPTKRFVYQISGISSATNIRDVFIETFPDSNVCKQIAKEGKMDIDESYIKELISVVSSDIDSININSVDDSNVIENNVSKDDTAMFTVEIIAETEEDCEKIGQILDQEINTFTLNLQKQFDSFILKKVGESYYEEAKNTLLLEQQTRVNEMYNTSALMRNLESTLTEQQKSYFYVLLDDGIEKIVDKSSDKNIEEMLVKENPDVQYINIKYVIVGAIGGLLLSCFFVLCKLFFNNRLVSNYYIIQDLHEPLLGVVREKNKKKGLGNKIDCWIKTLFLDKNERKYEEDKVKIICANLQLTSQKIGIKKVYITSSIDEKKSNYLIEKVSKNLKEIGMEISVGNSILRDENSLKKCVEMDGVVFVETRNESLLDDIEKEVECCKNYQLQNLGFIIVE